MASCCPRFRPTRAGIPGQADKRVQAYNFRIIATNNPANRIPWPKPAQLRPHALRTAGAAGQGDGEEARPPAGLPRADAHRATSPTARPTSTTTGAFSTDYIGKNYDYPDGELRRRDEIWQDHIDYVQGFYYFLANDPRVPPALQEEVREWGLPKDEYADTDHWPHQLYVREARRMVGEYVLIQKDLQTDRTKPDVIGMGSYNSDSHNVQRFVNAQGFAENEGDMQVAVQPYQIPFRMMLPKRAEAANLLVPVCFSASHVAYSSAAHGAAVHDHRPRGGGGRGAGHPRRQAGAGDRGRRSCRRFSSRRRRSSNTCRIRSRTRSEYCGEKWRRLSQCVSIGSNARRRAC